MTKIRKAKIIIPDKEPRIHQNGVTRPKKFFANGRANICVRIWQIADEISALHARETAAKAKATKKKQPPALPATRAEVLAQVNKENANSKPSEKLRYTTFVNEFYAWRIFNGIRGRIKKDGTPAKPYGYKGGKPRKGSKRPDIKPVHIGKPALPTRNSGGTVATPAKPVTASPWGN